MKILEYFKNRKIQEKKLNNYIDSLFDEEQLERRKLNLMAPDEIKNEIINQLISAEDIVYYPKEKNLSSLKYLTKNQFADFKYINEIKNDFLIFRCNSVWKFEENTLFKISIIAKYNKKELFSFYAGNRK